jgi:2'-5' RNA ligase
MSTDSGKEILCYWLIPAEPAWSYFHSLIKELARRFGAPIFEPHVTIYVSDDTNENADAVLEKALKGRGGFRLAIRGVDFSDNFTKTVFAKFERDAELTRLSSDLRRASTAQNDYELSPHLSLIYKAMAPDTKRNLIASIRLPFTEIHFDSVKAVISPAKIEARADVEAWRVAAQQSLTG